MTLRHPSGVTRLLAKLPLVFYRLGLGWLLGTLFVQITHRGRKSGVLRQTVLEVLRYDPHTREVVVVSGWGGKTDWYRNIQQEPALEIRIGRVAYQPVQKLLSPEETYAEVQATLQRRPQEARLLGPLLGINVTASESVLHTQIEMLFRGVRFCPAHSTSNTDSVH
jgi:deazaflavin-dependent oxidoreductase (nitroreductase family)